MSDIAANSNVRPPTTELDLEELRSFVATFNNDHPLYNPKGALAVSALLSGLLVELKGMLDKDRELFELLGKSPMTDTFKESFAALKIPLRKLHKFMEMVSHHANEKGGCLAHLNQLVTKMEAQQAHQTATDNSNPPAPKSGSAKEQVDPTRPIDDINSEERTSLAELADICEEKLSGLLDVAEKKDATEPSHCLTCCPKWLPAEGPHLHQVTAQAGDHKLAAKLEDEEKPEGSPGATAHCDVHDEDIDLGEASVMATVRIYRVDCNNHEN